MHKENWHKGCLSISVYAFFAAELINHINRIEYNEILPEKAEKTARIEKFQLLEYTRIEKFNFPNEPIATFKTCNQIQITL
ncbi:MAG: hypothetical protein ACI9CP_001808 [Cryomorphaceae bacterium]|jgi:hypothetical protein